MKKKTSRSGIATARMRRRASSWGSAQNLVDATSSADSMTDARPCTWAGPAAAVVVSVGFAVRRSPSCGSRLYRSIVSGTIVYRSVDCHAPHPVCSQDDIHKMTCFGPSRESTDPRGWNVATAVMEVSWRCELLEYPVSHCALIWRRPMPGIACVTGASGFLASELVAQLLGKGYRVQATVRSLANA